VFLLNGSAHSCEFVDGVANVLFFGFAGVYFDDWLVVWVEAFRDWQWLNFFCLQRIDGGGDLR